MRARSPSIVSLPGRLLRGLVRAGSARGGGARGVLLGAALVVGGWAATSGCGASVSAIYEGDVRFEHCMGLDARPTASPSERRMCWIEWVRYYTYGQTQDRVEYARTRSSGAEGLGDDRPEAPAPLTAPEPTSAFAPPPMMATAEPEAAASSGAPPPRVAPPAASSAPPVPAGDPACHADCAEAREDCRTSCQGASCEKSCSGKYTRCLERCAEVRGRTPR